MKPGSREVANGQRTWHVTIRARVRIPSTHINVKQAWWPTYNPNNRKVKTEDLGAIYLDKLTYLSSPSSARDLASVWIAERTLEEDI